MKSVLLYILISLLDELVSFTEHGVLMEHIEGWRVVGKDYNGDIYDMEK